MGARTRTRTIGAVLALVGKVVHPCNICRKEGLSSEFLAEYRRRINELIVAFYEENRQLSSTSTADLPLDMPLGKRSNRFYWELKAWLASQMPVGSAERAYFTEVDHQKKPDEP